MSFLCFPLSWHMDWAERLCREILRCGFSPPVAGLNTFPKSDKDNLLGVPISSQGCLYCFLRKRWGGFATRLPFLLTSRGRAKWNAAPHEQGEESHDHGSQGPVPSNIGNNGLPPYFLSHLGLRISWIKTIRFLKEQFSASYPPHCSTFFTDTKPILEACFATTLYAKHIDPYKQTIYISLIKRGRYAGAEPSMSVAQRPICRASYAFTLPGGSNERRCLPLLTAAPGLQIGRSWASSHWLLHGGIILCMRMSHHNIEVLSLLFSREKFSWQKFSWFFFVSWETFTMYFYRLMRFATSPCGQMFRLCLDWRLWLGLV